MNLTVGCTLAYDVLTPTANFTFNILANRDPFQLIGEERIQLTPEIPSVERSATSKGNRVFRVEVPQGPFEVAYRCEVAVTRPSVPEDVRPDNPGRLPLSILTYMLPSRYCESDRFSQIAWDLFGRFPSRLQQVREVCCWVEANLIYSPGATDSRTSAWDVWQSKKGVCRDYTHLSIALCRALSIPARYVGGYALGLDPMDFHACFEAYLGGQWYVFDPTDGISPERIVVIARGRDAANAPLTTIFGRVASRAVRVECFESPVISLPAAAEVSVGTPARSSLPG